MPLTDKAILNAKPSEKPWKLYDTAGLYVEIASSGGKWFRLKYRINGREKRISLGVYPATSLKQAREKRDTARKLIAEGIDPSRDRKERKLAQANRTANTFEVVAREWLANYGASLNEKHLDRVARRFERDIFPFVGSKPITEIVAAELLTVFRRIEARGAKVTARRALVGCSQVFRYAISEGHLENDPTRNLRGALCSPKAQHFAATIKPNEVAGILRAMDSYEGTVVVGSALRLMPLVFVRPGELRTAEWKDIELNEAEWRFTTSKTGTLHIVPLSRQAVSILRALHPVTGNGRYVFPSARSMKRPMSDNAILAAMRRVDIPQDAMTGHGFRAVARTLLDQELHFRPDFIEHQLAHAVIDPNGRAYNRTSFLPERKKMMQDWADYLDALKAGSPSIPVSAVLIEAI